MALTLDDEWNQFLMNCSSHQYIKHEHEHESNRLSRLKHNEDLDEEPDQDEEQDQDTKTNKHKKKDVMDDELANGLVSLRLDMSPEDVLQCIQDHIQNHQFVCPFDKQPLALGLKPSSSSSSPSKSKSKDKNKQDKQDKQKDKQQDKGDQDKGDQDKGDQDQVVEVVAPEPSAINISTKTKLVYLGNPIDLSVFWRIPILPYTEPRNGVVKKQIKLKSKSREEVEQIEAHLQHEEHVEEIVLVHIDNQGNPHHRIAYTDIRILNIGTSEKDLMVKRNQSNQERAKSKSAVKKKKQAFFNCFTIRLRVKYHNLFKEFHVKLFNTGEVEVPGLQEDDMFDAIVQETIAVLQPIHAMPLCKTGLERIVVINSNFNCGFHLDRDNLYYLLKKKYHIHATYESCSYPGIQCTIYLDKADLRLTEVKRKKIPKVTCIIFRTGSVLIVGKCEVRVLNNIYLYLTTILKTEFPYIAQRLATETAMKTKVRVKKSYKRVISVEDAVVVVEEDKDKDKNETKETTTTTTTNNDNVLIY